MRPRVGLLAVALVTLPAAVAGQARSDGGSAVAAEAAGLSLLLPGLGQHRLDRSRKWVYAAVEVAAWSLFAERRHAGGQARDTYRDFAWERGRLQAGTRLDGDFDYYETLTKWARSGAFDTDPGAPGVQPEADVSTYNGMIWERARGLFLGGGSGSEGDARYEQARAYYGEHAYGEEFLWSWVDDPAAQDELGALVSESDDRFRQATTAMGVVIANHVVSAIEAYVTGRADEGRGRVTFTPGRLGLDGGWSMRLSLPLGR